MMIYVVTGSRDFPDMDLVARRIKFHVNKDSVFFHGGARGVDTVAGDVAYEIGAEVILCEANWDKNGKAAGAIRNAEMLKVALSLSESTSSPLVCLAFWDGASRGTRDMMDKCKKANVTTITYAPRVSGAARRIAP